MLSIAYSPDSDDLFMIDAWKNDASQIYPQASFYSKEIHLLNQECMEGKGADLSAISAAAFPHLRDQYLILKSGMSFGRDFGPKLVVASANLGVIQDKLADPEKQPEVRVAVPGKTTTAFALMRSLYPQCIFLSKPFDAIEEAVLSGEADAGVFIHEPQLEQDTHQDQDSLFATVLDLGKAWKAPLPLGLIVGKAQLGRDRLVELDQLYGRSIECGWEDLEAQCSKLAEQTDYTEDFLKQYLTMYAQHGLTEEERKKWLQHFFHQTGLMPEFDPAKHCIF